VSIEADILEKGLTAIDLGCGRYKVPGTIGLDQSSIVNPDIVTNFVEEDLPFEDSSVDVVICRQVMEHVDDLFSLMNKIHRVLKADGVLVTEVPYWSSEGAFRDPTHVRFFSEKSFDYWDPDCECAYYADSAPFVINRVEYQLNPRKVVRLMKRLVGIRGLKAFNNMIVGLRFELKPVK
jgi:SAM-dependent methyltransferase